MALHQNTDYEVASFAEVASIINHFTPEMIEDIIDKAIANNEINYSQSLPNIPQAIEATYKQQMERLPQFSADMIAQKTSLYYSIIEKLTRCFGLQYTGGETTDVYSAVYWLYDFLISKFDKYMIEYLSNYIMRESDMFYQMLVTKEDRKDTSSYTRRVFKGDNLAIGVIHANLEWCLDNMLQFDIELNDIITTSFGPQYKPFADFLNSIIGDRGDFFRRIYVPFILANKAVVLTNIKFTLQGRANVGVGDFTVR